MDKKIPVHHMVIDTMLINLLQDCYNHSYADVSSHFYQLVTQTLHTEPNITGPMKPFTGKTIVNKATGKAVQVTKKVDIAVPQDISIWVVRGFYPETGIPFKMVIWRNEHHYWGNKTPHVSVGVNIKLGSFSKISQSTHVNVHEVDKYVEEFSERIILDQSTEDLKKPEVSTPTYRTMTPKGLTKQAKKKREKVKTVQRSNEGSSKVSKKSKSKILVSEDSTSS